MILAHHGIAMNGHARNISLDEDSTASPLRAAIAGNDTATELTIEGIAEIDASPLRRGRLQSVVRDAAAPHSQRALLAPDPTSSGTFRGVYSVRLNRAAGDLSMAVLKEESAAASDYSN